MPANLMKIATILGLASVLTAAAGSSSLAQTQRQGSPAVRQPIQPEYTRPVPLRETTGRAQGSCWIPVDDNEKGYGYWGSCDAPRARPVK
jgi:hypothetical protein